MTLKLSNSERQHVLTLLINVILRCKRVSLFRIEYENFKKYSHILVCFIYYLLGAFVVIVLVFLLSITQVNIPAYVQC